MVHLCNSLFTHQEVRQIREKSAAEIADLEGIAQAHYSRANRLGDELNYLRAEHFEIVRRVCYVLFLQAIPTTYSQASG